MKTARVLLLILFGASSYSLAQAPSSQNGLPPEQQTQTLKHFKINLSITNLGDLKVRSGDRITAGQIISDRSTERERLNRERRETLLAIARLEGLPQPMLKTIAPPRQLPGVSFAAEEEAIEKAQLKFTQAQRNYNNALTFDPFITARANLDFAKAAIQQAYRDVELQQKKLESMTEIKGLPPEMLVHETEKLKLKRSEWEKKQAEYNFRASEYKQVEQRRKLEIADLNNELELARKDVQSAQADLIAAQEQRRRQEYEHEITIARHHEQANQNALALSRQNLEKEFKLKQMKEQLAVIDEKMAQIAVVRSPYNGTVKRVKTEGQSNNTIRVTLTLIPGGDGQ
ncbi:MAG: hypothetical protein N5P05_001239 [Chroococcopsis gigantea SAG 12.99]|jgi:chromosome segregation ATPase|nr:hypothetical protein [Chlorogloea purpurea SAG 13.99]MDV2999633.1 hypothetical protein [Chroococcopsis gigantea SAG 12.99]